MGYAAMGQTAGDSWEQYDPNGWQFISRRGHPQQAYGEPFPASDWIWGKVRELYTARTAKRYAHADAIRQWLRDYGIVVEYERDRIRAKW